MKLTSQICFRSKDRISRQGSKPIASCRRAAMAASGESCRRHGHISPSVRDPLRKWIVRRNRVQMLIVCRGVGGAEPRGSPLSRSMARPGIARPRQPGPVVGVEEGQPVVSTGPYAYVRHPMYSGALLLLAAMPLALGSWWGVLLVAPFFPVLVWRILDEEIFLRQNLPGYDEYMQRVRYRLVSRVW